MSGFTLIEVMVIVVIIGIITTIGIPTFIKMTEAAKQASTKGYIATLRSATNIYYSENMYYPYQYSDLPNTTDNNVKYDTIKTKEQKSNNAWVPKYMSDWIPAIRIGRKDWVSNTTGKIHEGANDMRIIDSVLSQNANNNLDEEIIYNCQTGVININCEFLDKEGKYIYEW